jgi:hypothetical protein
MGYELKLLRFFHNTGRNISERYSRMKVNTFSFILTNIYLKKVPPHRNSSIVPRIFTCPFNAIILTQEECRLIGQKMRCEAVSTALPLILQL